MKPTKITQLRFLMTIGAALLAASLGGCGESADPVEARNEEALGSETVSQSSYFRTGGVLVLGSRRADRIRGTRGDDFLFGFGGNDRVRGRGGDDSVSGGRGDDRLRGDSGNDRIRGNTGDDDIDGGEGDDTLRGGRGNDAVKGAEGVDEVLGGPGDDVLNGGPEADTLEGGPGADTFVHDGDPFDGADVSADGRQIVGNEDFIEDFNLAEDIFGLDAADFAVLQQLVFQSLDANVPDASIDPGANVIVLVNADNDDDPETPFLAGTAANQIAALGASSTPGFFLYFNSNLQLNRLVYSTDLSTPEADLKILNRLTNAVGEDAALATFTADNFVFIGEELEGGDADDALVGAGGPDSLFGDDGNDFLSGFGDSDNVHGGDGYDLFVYEGDPFDGVDVSADGRQIVGNEDFLSDFDTHEDAFALSFSDFGVPGDLSFQSLDANAPDAEIAEGANVIVLVNADSDDDPETPFLAGTAANQIAARGASSTPGFFLYFNSNLQLNRLVYSTDLSTPTADLKILNRLNNAIGEDAVDALAAFTEENFVPLSN